MNEARLNELLNKIYYEYLDRHEAEEFIIYFKKLKQDKDNLQSKIDKAKRILDANTHVENIYHALCNLFDEEYQYEIDNEELNKILKEDK